MNTLKQLQGIADFFAYLTDKHFTYNEAQELIKKVQHELDFNRECDEFETVEDYFNNRPCCDIGNKVISGHNYFDVEAEIMDAVEKINSRLQ